MHERSPPQPSQGRHSSDCRVLLRRTLRSCALQPDTNRLWRRALGAKAHTGACCALLRFRLPPSAVRACGTMPPRRSARQPRGTFAASPKKARARQGCFAAPCFFRLSRTARVNSTAPQPRRLGSFAAVAVPSLLLFGGRYAAALAAAFSTPAPPELSSFFVVSDFFFLRHILRR